jgi:hypothetical protein
VLRFDIYGPVGVVGAVLIIAAYFANQQGWTSSRNWPYLLANLTGSAFILASLYAQWNLPAALIEGFWALISLYGLARQFRSSWRR